MNNSEIERLITRKLTGEASTQELSKFRSWLDSSDQNRDEFNKISVAYQLSKAKPSSGNKKAQIFNRISNRIEGEHKRRFLIEWKVGRNYAKTWLSIAASIVLILSLSLFYNFNNSKVGLTSEKLTQVVQKSNPAGQKSKVFLPDGSTVWLNSESSISYESEFNDSSRHVHLSGEAFFEVKKDVSRPFVVYSGSISTTALGTAFNINAFDINNITVSLTDGKVNVATTVGEGISKSLIINRGEGVVYNPSSKNTIDKIKINPDEVMMWKDGLLKLNHSTLKETITSLERWYGVDIILTNEPIQEWDAFGTFSNEYLENVLNALSFSQKFDYELDKKKVYITFKEKVPM